MFFENRDFVFTRARTRLTYRPSSLLFIAQAAELNGLRVPRREESNGAWLRLAIASSLAGREVRDI